MKKQRSGGNTRQNQKTLDGTVKARMIALRGKWSGYVTLISPIPDAPSKILVNYRFNISGDTVTGEFSFESWKRGRGVVTNTFQGKFMNQKQIILSYQKKTKYVIGFGHVTLEISPDMRELCGYNSGVSSHTGEPFVSGVFLKRSLRTRVKTDFERKYLNRINSLLPRIFIGHGRSDVWRKLSDHLATIHNYSVEAYEFGARAGQTIPDVLKLLLERSSMAFLIMTAEDRMKDGQSRARQNVVHEIGMFQGRLGISRAIILMEEGVESFSNISGINYIRFKKGAIQSIFGDIIATINREFPR